MDDLLSTKIPIQVIDDIFNQLENRNICTNNVNTNNKEKTYKNKKQFVKLFRIDLQSIDLTNPIKSKILSKFNVKTLKYFDKKYIFRNDKFL